uniref:LOW QUALITY PROTEIN: brevican core protein-like n=1 Tax=Monopterus albus TaxID=43700 RepID=UPI0009B30047|nr:LOW QUALITY PROTEIN: brevican core protein-like [Monopterus albus]
MLRSRHVQIFPLLCAVCHLTLAFPTQSPSAYDDGQSSSDDGQSLKVNIPHSGALVAPLGSSVSFPCLVSRSSTPSTSSAPAVPRVKWTVVSDGVETQILVVKGQRVKVSEAYQGRAALLNYTSSPDDLSLWLGDLRSSDSGYYRCEVQQGLEDASDLIQLKVKGVVFHYRDALGRYAFSYHQAQMACEAIGAEIATPDQLLAAYYNGYEQCDAGWLADQSVRYPIQFPREGCYGDMEGQPGVRNYGTVNPADLYDVYCYVEAINGEVFHDSVPQQLSFHGAQSYCRAAGAELATTAQLYLAWSEGLDRCSPGWLSDGSVRYPITAPRERCGGPQAGVKTLYRFSNQTGFPEPSSLHDVYCFKDKRNTSTDFPMDFVATEPEDIGQDIIFMKTDQELQLHQQHGEQVEREAQSEVVSVPYSSSPSTEESLVDTYPESPLTTMSTIYFLRLADEPLLPTEIDSQDPTALTYGSISSTGTYDFPQSTSLLPTVFNDTDSYQNLTSTFHQSELESSTGLPEPSYEPHAYNQTVLDIAPEQTQPSVKPKDSQEIQDTILNLNRSQASFSETNSNYPQEENILEETPLTPDNLLQVKLEEAAVEDPVQVSLSTESPREDVTLPTNTTHSPIKNLTSLWFPLDGSGDVSQESDHDVEEVSFMSTSDSSTSSFTTHLSPSASAEPETAVPDPTHSSVSQNTDKLGFTILWESPISKQEGSTSLEIEDSVIMESEGEQLHPTNISFVSLAATESPGGSHNSQLPTNSSAAQYQTSDYRVHLDTTTTAHEEASGQEPGIVNETLGEDVNVGPTPDEDVYFSQIVIKEVTVPPALAEEMKISSTSMEGKVYFSIAPTLEKEAYITPNPEEAKGDPGLEKEADIVPTLVLEEKGSVSPALDEETTAAPTIALEEEPNVDPTIVKEAYITPIPEEPKGDTSLEKEADTVPTLEEETNSESTLVEDINIAPTIALEEGPNIEPTLEDRANVDPTPEGGANIESTLGEDINIAPIIVLEEGANLDLTPEEGANVDPTPEGRADIEPTLEDRANFDPTPEGGANIEPALEEGSNVSPTFEEDFTVFPLISTRSNWAHLPTTNGPQESLNDLEYSTKTSSITSTAAPDSTSSTKSSVATTKTTATTITTTTHWFRRTWSPTTLTRKAFHKTTEPQKVTHLIPPVDHGLVDVEFSLTQPPTLLILPKERAAVGGAGKDSDACVDDPCLNGGTCTDREGKIQCLCLPTYRGDFCQTDLEQCEPGWDKFHGFCYKHFTQRLSWEVAEQHCRMQGAHLVSIMTPEEQNYINSHYKEYQWTGLNDKTIEDDFRWSDGSPLLYENWYRGQPDSYFLSGEDCVVMVWHDDGRWSDVPCNYHLAYTCKKGTSSCGPPPKVRNASIYGRVRQRYETSAVVRYYCAKGFQQRLNPLIRCLSGGRWERPQILCMPEAGSPTQHPEVTSPTNSDNFAEIEDEFEATKERPQYRDIKF